MNIDNRKICVCIDEGSWFLYKNLCELKGIKKFIYRSPNNRFLKTLRKIHTSYRIGKYISLPGKDIWFNFNKLASLVDDDGILVINSVALSMPSCYYWKRLKRLKPNARFVLLLVDSLDAHSRHLEIARKYIFKCDWDLVLSYDKNDCQKYGFSFLGYQYYSMLYVSDNNGDNIDMYYIGGIKTGRERVLKAINDRCRKKNVKNVFKIVSPWHDVDYGDRLTGDVSYAEVVYDVVNSNCILEVLQDDQHTQSIRYMEAVCYNKKLLTNNPDLKNLPYYDARYMKYFDTVDDIDWEWVRKREEINYNYKGDFSSAGIINSIRIKLGSV